MSSTDVRLYGRSASRASNRARVATILRKRPGSVACSPGFDPEAVARFDDRDVERPSAMPASSAIGKIDDHRQRPGDASPCRTTWGSPPPWCGRSSLTRPDRPASARMGDRRPPRRSPPALFKELSVGFRFGVLTTAYAAMQSLGVVDDHPRGLHAAATPSERDRAAAAVPPLLAPARGCRARRPVG